MPLRALLQPLPAWLLDEAQKLREQRQRASIEADLWWLAEDIQALTRPTRPILVTRRGIPLSELPAPPANATTEQRIAWLRADNAYRDQLAELANNAFDKALKKALKS